MKQELRTKDPVDCVVAVTYLCNSRCTMCDFWKETRQPTTTLDDYRKLPKSLRDINVSGGEPFLHPEIVDIVRVLRETCPRAKITISTNGFLTKQIVERVRAMREHVPDVGIRISIDGVGDAHERIRRIPKGFEKCVATLHALQGIGVSDIGIAYTMTEDNVEELERVYAFARDEGVQCTFALAHTSAFYFGGKANADHLRDRAQVGRVFDQVKERELATWKPKRWARAYFLDGLKELALHGTQRLPSRAGEDYFFLDPFGNVYPSVVHPNVLGNLSESASWEAIWSSKQAIQARKATAKSSTAYWLVCTARTAIRRHIVRVLAWIAWEKMKLLLRTKRGV
jgi:Fe-coproporphyrin III synthase